MVEGRLDPPDPLARDRGDGRSAAIRRCSSDVSAALIQIRGAKSQASVSMKTEISLAKFYGTAEALAHLQAVEADLRAVGRITGEHQLG